MRTVTFKSVLHGTAQKMGLDPNTPDVNLDQALSLTEFINSRVRQVYDHALWPETKLIEERHYRDNWDSSVSYYAGQEVWVPSEESYYIALIDNEDVDPSDVASSLGVWSIPDVLRKYLPYQQAGKIEVDALIQAYERDPRITGNPPTLSFNKLSDGYQFENFAPNSVFIEFRSRAPIFTAIEYSPGVQYHASEVVYVADEGECYKALRTTEGMDPVTSIADWAKVDFPYFMSEVVKEFAYSDLLVEDGELSKAKARLEVAEEMLVDSEIVEFDQQRQQEKFTVQGY